MEYASYGKNYVIRLDKGDEIMEKMREFATKENVKLASISGIGATDDFTLGVFNLEKKEYELTEGKGNHEIAALVGNINTMDGDYYGHFHMTAAGPGGKVLAGHLLRAVISLTAEIFVTVIDGDADRRFDPEIGINLYHFN